MLLSLVPRDGKSIGNKMLLQDLRKEAKDDIPDESYWEIRNDLIIQGLIEKGRGYGGSVHRVKDVVPEEGVAKKHRIREADLYSMVSQYIEKTWVKDNGISQFVLERTASQGRKKTGGKWTRPDFALIALKSFAYIPGKVLELITFEVKPENDYRIEGVFETAAQSRFSTKSYLLIHLPDGAPDKEEFKRVERECERFGLGLIMFKDPQDWSTYSTLQEAERRNPDPADVNSFITSQLSKDNQNHIQLMVK
jgi:hypothetical protein